ncbi:unnamed protein product [Caretta caretta]
MVAVFPNGAFRRLSSLTNVHGRGALLAYDGIYHVGGCAANLPNCLIISKDPSTWWALY